MLLVRLAFLDADIHTNLVASTAPNSKKRQRSESGDLANSNDDPNHDETQATPSKKPKLSKKHAESLKKRKAAEEAKLKQAQAEIIKIDVQLQHYCRVCVEKPATVPCLLCKSTLWCEEHWKGVTDDHMQLYHPPAPLQRTQSKDRIL